jgi:hypothetical protein
MVATVPFYFTVIQSVVSLQTEKTPILRYTVPVQSLETLLYVAVPIECARRNWRKNWRKTLRQFLAQSPLLCDPCANFEYPGPSVEYIRVRQWNLLGQSHTHEMSN